MRTIENLTEGVRNKKLGNHRLEVDELNSDLHSYYYFYTEICRANWSSKRYWVDDSFGTVSTTRACNAYRVRFDSLGFTEVESGVGTL